MIIDSLERFAAIGAHHWQRPYCAVMPDFASTGSDISGSGGSAFVHPSQEPQRVQDFDNPSFAWRRLFSEAFGTFLLVLVAVGGDVVGTVTGAPPSRAATATAPALMVMVVILFMGRISGAHLNPVVSMAFALRGEFPWHRVPGYVVAQLVGGIVACVFLWALFGRPGLFGATIPASNISDMQATLVEAVLTLGLVSTILGTASSAQNVGPLSAIAVGGYIALAGLWGGAIGGASMNPVRSFAPALVRADFAHIWAYMAGPLIGALVAVAFAHLLRGRGGDSVATRAAQGDSAAEDHREVGTEEA
jgi:aquaporin Z